MSRFACAVVLGAVALLAPGRAAAESHASSTGKGIVAGALLGAEAVTITEAALGVRPGWAYLVGGGAGAAGGAVGGYFLESASPRLNIYLLAAGMALVIPTTVAVLNATAYEPPADYTEDRAPLDEPAEEPAEPEDFRTQRRRTSPHSERHAMRDVNYGLFAYGGTWQLAVPAVSVGEVYSRTERSMFGVDQETEVLVSLLDVRF